MTACPNCKYGLWTNGLELFFFATTRSRFDVKFKPIGDWPMGDESIGTRDVEREAPTCRPRDVAHGFSALSQLHPRQRGHAQDAVLPAGPILIS